MPKHARPPHAHLLRLPWKVLLIALCAAFLTGCALNSDSGSSTDTTNGSSTQTPTTSGSGAVQVSNVSPGSGSTSGGTVVTISGANFRGNVTVAFGTHTVKATVLSPEQVKATTPANGAGVVDVTVTSSTNGSGTFQRGFNYIQSVLPAATITSISPNSGPIAGGQTITITGTNLQSDAQILIGGTACNGLVFQSTTQLTCVTPAGIQAGPTNVTYTAGSNGTLTVTNGYTYNAAMTVTQVSPNFGPLTGSTSVTITGTNFASISNVQFGSNNATSVTVVDAQTITAVTPAATTAGTITVTVNSSTNGSASLGSAFTYSNLATGPRQSSTIAISETDTLIAVNPENDTVSVFDSASSGLTTNKRDITVGSEPRSVAITPDGTKAYVANTRSGTVSVITLATGAVSTIAVQKEPRAVVLTPNSKLCIVANAISNTISVIDTATNNVTQTISLANFITSGANQPRALAITNNGDLNDLDETLYVPMFFSERKSGQTGLNEGEDTQREGVVLALTFNPLNGAKVTLNSLASGFNANGSTLTAGGLAPQNPPNFNTATSCFPNQLAAMAIHPVAPNRAYVVSTAASPNGPFRFNVNVQGVVSVFNTSGGSKNLEVTGNNNGNAFIEAPLNMNKGVQFDPATFVNGAQVSANNPRFFNSNPTAIVWKPDGSEAWVAIQTADTVVRLTADASGFPSVNAAASNGAPNSGNITRVDLQSVVSPAIQGKAPFGLCFNKAGTRLFVNNFVSRSVTSIDPTNRSIVATAQAGAAAPQGDIVQLGAELFFTGRGPTNSPTAVAGLPRDAMSSEGWGACIACHPDGRTDNVTWMFDAGPRQTISLDGTFSKRTQNDQRILNWSAVRDENQDFELNTRGVSGGRGLINDDRHVIVVGGRDGANNPVATMQEFTAPVSLTNPMGIASLNNSVVSNNVLPTSANTPRFKFASATLPDGTLIYAGGQIVNAPPSDEIDIVEFNPNTNVLRRRSSMGIGRHSFGAAAVNTASGPRVYLIGGFDNGGNPLTTVEEFNPTTGTTRSTVAPLPAATGEFGICTVYGNNTTTAQDIICVVGGNTGSDNPMVNPVAETNAVYLFKPPQDSNSTGSWTGPIALGVARNQLMAASILRGVSNRVFKIGGKSGGTAKNTVEEITVTCPAGGAPTAVLTGSTVTQLPFNRAGSAVAVSQNNIYIIGGVDETDTPLGSVVQGNFANNVSNPGPNPGTPTGTWNNVLTLNAPISFLAASSPPPVANLTPVGNSFRDSRQDAISEWIKVKVRSHIAPLAGTQNVTISNGVQKFQGQLGFTLPNGLTCASCHGGPKWTRSTVDYQAPPSTDLSFGFQQIIGAELRATRTQPRGGITDGVLCNVNTFDSNSANEIRLNPADVSNRLVGQTGALGQNGFNIPSLLSVGAGGPYFHNGRALTLNEVFDGSCDGQAGPATVGVRFHNINGAGGAGSTQDALEIIEFLKTIDDSTTPIP